MREKSYPVLALSAMNFQIVSEVDLADEQCIFRAYIIELQQYLETEACF